MKKNFFNLSGRKCGLDFSPRSWSWEFKGLKSLSHWLTIVLLVSTSFLNAAEKAKPVPPRPTVVIPYDPEKPVSSQEAKRVYIDYEAFQSMWKKVKNYRAALSGNSAKEPKDFTLSTGMYRIHSSEKRLVVKGKIILTTRGTEWQKIPIPFEHANISKMMLDGEPASYQGGAIMVEKPGNHVLEVEYEITLDKATSSAKWSIPTAGASLLEIEMDSAIAEPVITLQNSVWPLAESQGKFFGPNGNSTFYTAAIGRNSEIHFQRRLKTTGRAMTRPSVADIDARLFIAPGLERIEATYLLRFEGQEENRFTIGFDESVTPVQFEIPNLASWEMGVSETNPLIKTLTFTLSQAVRDEVRVRFIGERLLDSKTQASKRTFPRFSADALRIEQRMSLLRVDDISVKTTAGGDIRQVSFSMNRKDQSGFHPVAAYSLSGENDTLTYQSKKVSPEQKITASYLYQVGTDKLETIARFQIRSPEAPLLSSALKIPTDAKIQIVSGNRVKDWWRTGDELFVRYSGGTPETTNLLVYVAQQLDEESRNNIPVTPFPFVGMKNEDVSGTGLIVAHVTRDTSLKLNENRQVIREIGVDEINDDSEVLKPLERKRGFRFERMNFSGEISLTKVEPKFDALWVMLAQMHENWTRISMHVDIEVTRSGLNRVLFTTPEAMPEFRVLSDDVREMRHTLVDGVRHYEIVFQQFVTDAISFTLETEIPHDGTVSIPDLAIIGANRQERFVIVENQSREKMSLSPAGMETTIPSLLPYKPEALRTAQIFRAQPKWSLEAEIEHLETSAGNQAVILYASLTSAFRANGEEWLKAVYHMQNRSLQFLPVQLPEDSELISVVVAGNEVRADSGIVEGKPVILVPLIQTKPGQLAYDVELVLRSQKNANHSNSKPASKLERHLDDPAVFGLTIETTLWSVFLPKGHEITDFGGNMQQVQAEENAATMLRCDLTELGQLNKIAADFDNGAGIQIASVGNGGALVQRIEKNLKKLESSQGFQGISSSAFRNDLEKQKTVLTENRINMPTFKRIDQEEEKNDRKQVNWGDGNSEKFLTRNNVNADRSKDQIDRVKSQVRLNDNISITEEFINLDTLEEKVKSKAKESNDATSQIGILAGNGGNIAVNQRVSVLNRIQNRAQIGHGGVQTTGKKAKNPARKASKKSKASQFGDFDNGRSSLMTNGPYIPEPNAAPIQKTAQSGDISVTPSSGYVTIGQPALRPEGRSSVSIDFPVEGDAVYFQKLKDHAEIDLSTAVPSNSGKGRNLLWFIALVSTLFLGRDLWQRSFGPNRVRSVT